MEEQKKKILYVITKSNWGGAQKYVYDLATSVPKADFEPIVAFGGSGPLADKLSLAGVRTITVNSLQRDINIFGDIKSFFGLLSILKKERPDVIHVNSSKVGGLGALAARLTGVRRIIFTCHGWPFNEERGLLSLWTIRLLSWLTVMLSHVTITVSGRDLRDGKIMFAAKNKVILVHNGVREPDFKAKNKAFSYIQTVAKEKGVEISENDFLVGAVGELHKNKGYEYLLTAFSKLGPDSKLVILGEGEERDSLNKKIKDLTLEKRVALIGFVENAPTYMKAFNALALSSIKEGLPYVVIEAGFAALPVVATNVGGVKEIIDDMRSGILVQTHKPEDIAQSLNFIKDDSEKARSFGNNLRDKTINEFSLSKMVEETVAIYLGTRA